VLGVEAALGDEGLGEQLQQTVAQIDPARARHQGDVLAHDLLTLALQPCQHDLVQLQVDMDQAVLHRPGQRGGQAAVHDPHSAQRAALDQAEQDAELGAGKTAGHGQQHVALEFGGAGQILQMGIGQVGVVAEMRHRPRKRVETEPVPELIEAVQRIESTLTAGALTELDTPGHDSA